MGVWLSQPVSARVAARLDVGWDDVEEIDVGVRGGNYGWPCYEGRIRTRYYRERQICRSLYTGGETAKVFPLVAWRHDAGNSITGGVFIRPAEYVYGDYGHFWLRTLRVDGSDRLVLGSDELLARGVSTPVQIRKGPDGELYYLSLAGSIHRIGGTNR